MSEQYVHEGRLPNGWWYAAFLFLLGLATWMTVEWTVYAAVMYIWPVLLFLLGWGEVQQEGRRPAQRRPC